VLGEDGFANLILTEGHKRLQSKLAGLEKQGFFLCIASKNQHDDVVKLFETRKDFPLKINSFTKIVANWNSKAQSIKEIADYLNIHTESILFIDDNAGEILEVKHNLPNIKFILAREDTNTTINILDDFPGLLKLNLKKEDAIRSQDMKANEKRVSLSHDMSKEDYIKSLNTELIFSVNDISHAQRVSELACKTNQFIFSFKRYSVVDIENLMKGVNSVVVSISLKDDLSESGIIGCCVFNRTSKVIVLEECFVSCRALGRGLDEIIVLKAISIALDYLGSNLLTVCFKKGDRNTPAEIFVKDFLEKHLDKSCVFEYKLNDTFLRISKGENMV
jgi:FkbH-like protein